MTSIVCFGCSLLTVCFAFCYWTCFAFRWQSVFVSILKGYYSSASSGTVVFIVFHACFSVHSHCLSRWSCFAFGPISFFVDKMRGLFGAVSFPIAVYRLLVAFFVLNWLTQVAILYSNGCFACLIFSFCGYVRSLLLGCSFKVPGIYYFELRDWQSYCFEVLHYLKWEHLIFWQLFSLCFSLSIHWYLVLSRFVKLEMVFQWWLAHSINWKE